MSYTSDKCDSELIAEVNNIARIPTLNFQVQNTR